MAKVLVARSLDFDQLGPLTDAGHHICFAGDWPDLEQLAGAYAVMTTVRDRVDADVIGAAPHLQVVANIASGYDNVDVRTCSAAGVAVCTVPEVLKETTADLAFALILAASRRMSEAEAELRAGRWAGWDLDSFLGHDVHGATLGVVGFGQIGQAVARRARAFSMRVLHHSRRPTGQEGYVAALDDLLRQSDIVSLHVALNPDSEKLMNARRIALMKKTAVLVNTSRGSVVDEEALADALAAGRLFAAGLDVYEGEPEIAPQLLAAPRTVLLPHIGSASYRTRQMMIHRSAENIRLVLAGEPGAGVINAEALRYSHE